LKNRGIAARGNSVALPSSLSCQESRLSTLLPPSLRVCCCCLRCFELGERCMHGMEIDFLYHFDRSLLRTRVFWQTVIYCVGGGLFATLARCPAGIDETEARSLGALAVLEAVVLGPLDDATG